MARLCIPSRYRGELHGPSLPGPVTYTLSQYTWRLIIIIIMEICKAPTLRLKALNKHTHIMYIEMENVINNNKKR